MRVLFPIVGSLVVVLALWLPSIRDLVEGAMGLLWNVGAPEWLASIVPIVIAAAIGGKLGDYT